MKGHGVSKVSANLLNRLLANTAVLLQQTLHYHWNIVGPEFNDYHKMLDDQYNELFKDLDLIAERVRAVQAEALGTMQDMIKHADLKEDGGPTPTSKQMMINILHQYERHIKAMSDGIILLEKETSDFGSKKMLEDLIEKYEKTAWMLRSLTR